MVNLFGEEPAKEAVRVFNEQTGKEIGGGRSQHDLQKGGLVIPVITTPSVALPTPQHTFYGTERM